MEEDRPRAESAADPPAPDPGVGARTFNAELYAIRRVIPYSLLGLALNAIVLAYVLWTAEPAWLLRAWLGVVLGVTVLRYLHFRLLAPSQPEPERVARWWGQVYAGVIGSGVVWGMVALLPVSLDITHLIFIAFLTGGLAAGATAAYSVKAWLPHAFIVPATAGVTIGLLLHGGIHTVVMAVMVALFGVLLSTMAHGFHGVILTALQLRTKNEGLVANLTEERDHTQRLNAELRQEIGDRGQIERALRESEERFRSLVESATDGIGFTFEGRIHYANQAALDLIGYEAHEVLGMPIEQFLATTTLDADALSRRYQDRLAGEAVPNVYETQMRRKDGTIVDVMFSNSRVELDGRMGVMSMVKDITERKKAEEELRAAKETAEEATRLKDQFVSLLAHDLRAPLNSMFSMIRLLEHNPEHPLVPEQQEVLRLVADQGDATLHMIEDLLSVSQLHTGKLQPQMRFADACAIIATTVRQLAGIAREKRIAVVNAVPQGTRVYTDPEMTAKVLYNLLSNAIKFTPRGGAVRVQVPDGGPTTVAVVDNGPGVDPALLDDLFRHEVKTTTPGSAGERGTGLGLPLAQDMMRALGGEIRLAASSAAGSEFHAVLPPVRPRVLVVGRDESLHLFVRPHLEAIEADCVTAQDAAAALQRLESETVHLVIMETGPEALNGTDVVRQLRESSTHGAVPLMLIADGSQSSLVEDGFRMGADDIVVKPLVPNDFLMRLRRFIM